MYKYKGWRVHEVSSGFFGGTIKLIKSQSWWDKLINGEEDIYTFLYVSVHWGHNPFDGWIELLEEAAKKYIDSGAEEALRDGVFQIDVPMPELVESDRP
jgi:hypothetical protein